MKMSVCINVVCMYFLALTHKKRKGETYGEKGKKKAVQKVQLRRICVLSLERM